jgi:uncharacterized protein
MANTKMKTRLRITSEFLTADYADITDNQYSSHKIREGYNVTDLKMKNSFLCHLRLFIPLFCVCTVVPSLPAQTPEAGTKAKQFIYVLRLVPRLHSDAAWTKDDEAALARHLTRFKHAIETGELILAGRTLESSDKTFGIAVFEARDEAAARTFMESDPAVVAGLMTAELHPFAVALQRKNP